MTIANERVFRQMAERGAEEVTHSELLERSQVIQSIGPDDEISLICIQLEQLIASAARNAGKAIRVIDRIRGTGSFRDDDLLTALKKYVEDTCEAIRIVDNKLKDNDSSLDSLFAEVPSETTEDSMSWRNLIGRRNIIAHNLFTLDDERIYRDALRDFEALHQLLSRIHFVPTVTDLASGEGFSPAIKIDTITDLRPSRVGETPEIGNSLIIACQDKHQGFLAVKFGRTATNRALFATSRALSNLRLSFHALTQNDTEAKETDSSRQK
ncbi:MAG: DUF86 domain-containing protein [Caldilineaceae bacterium]|nr:DUF86 domain-containing protein [Caldilineaceae bacterium]MCY4116931.1 DUF86 domain-containing protein [Caldilineaceae bacterium]